MKMYIKHLLLLPALIAVFNLFPASRVTAQTFTALHSFTLQSTTNLISPAVWSTNSPAPVVIGGQNVVINPIAGAQKYFRLISN